MLELRTQKVGITITSER